MNDGAFKIRFDRCLLVVAFLVAVRIFIIGLCFLHVGHLHDDETVRKSGRSLRAGNQVGSVRELIPFISQTIRYDVKT